MAVFNPKDLNSKASGQYWGITQLNIEGKNLFLVMVRRMNTYLMENGYINISCQKARVPGFPGCVEHVFMIWEQIQTSK